MELTTGGKIIALGVSPTAILIVPSEQTSCYITPCIVYSGEVGTSVYTTNGSSVTLTVNSLIFNLDEENLTYKVTNRNTDGTITTLTSNIIVDIYIF